MGSFTGGDCKKRVENSNDSVPYKGMHGHNPELPESQGGCIVYGHSTNKMEIDSIRLACVFDILKEALKI